ncbi:MAG TPA: GMC family oxidoreductase N-terminal domain-containing protein [Candidatus Limnocylindrales bacterium]
MPDPLATLGAIVDTFVPASDGLPAASALGVHRAILHEVDALGRPDLAGQLRLLLRAMEHRPGSLALVGRPLRFSQLSHAEREAYLRRMAVSRIPLTRTAFQDLKRLTLLLAYGLEGSPYQRSTGYVPVAPAAAAETPLDVRTPAAGEVIEADACVIGSGAGGGVAAAVLAGAGRRVVILERAAEVRETDFGGPELDGLARLFLDRGLAATSDRWLSIRAGSAVGGGTVVNWSSSLRLPDAIAEEWRRAGVDGLEPHYEAVEAALSVGTAESIPNGPNRVLARGLEALGLGCQVIPRNTRGCGECGPCAVGCRIGAKQSVRRTYLAEASQAGARILDRTDARRILVEGGRATGVVAAVPGGDVVVRAPLVALAGGAILSPALLLRSGIASRTAGRGLLLHPVSAVVGFYDETVEPWSGVPQAVMTDAFADLGEGEGIRVEAAPMQPGLIATGYPWWSAAQHRATMAQVARAAAFIGLVRDRTPGRVDVARSGAVRVRYGVGGRERALLARATVELARIHRAAGAQRVATLHTPPLELGPGEPFEPFAAEIGRRGIVPNRILLFTAHQMASCRIGIDAAASVADPTGQVRGVRGLFVTDASAFPSSSGVNPMLTIMALARRTAQGMAAG